jgi:hypothetical protein
VATQRSTFDIWNSDFPRAGVQCSESDLHHSSFVNVPGSEGAILPSPHSESWFKRHALAGLCCGLAISSEYTEAIAVGGVLTLALLTSFKRGLVLVLAAIPPLLLIPLYNWACFGGPLAFGYHHLALEQFQEMNKGLFGITLPPKASAAYLILFSPARGLFFWTPFFLMAFFGLRSLFATSRKLFLVSTVVAILHAISISGYYMPSGGGALGPRHLAPMLPFLTVLALVGFHRCLRIGFFLGYSSIVLTGLATLINAMPSQHIPNPLLEVYVPGILRGAFTHNFGLYFGLPHEFSLLLIIAMILLPYIGACSESSAFSGK